MMNRSESTVQSPESRLQDFALLGRSGFAVEKIMYCRVQQARAYGAGPAQLRLQRVAPPQQLLYPRHNPPLFQVHLAFHFRGGVADLILFAAPSRT
jgi:hypothetical protein